MNGRITQILMEAQKDRERFANGEELTPLEADRVALANHIVTLNRQIVSGTCPGCDRWEKRVKSVEARIDRARDALDGKR